MHAQARRGIPYAARVSNCAFSKYFGCVPPASPTPSGRYIFRLRLLICRFFFLPGCTFVLWALRILCSVTGNQVDRVGSVVWVSSGSSHNFSNPTPCCVLTAPSYTMCLTTTQRNCIDEANTHGLRENQAHEMLALNKSQQTRQTNTTITTAVAATPQQRKSNFYLNDIFPTRIKRKPNVSHIVMLIIPVIVVYGALLAETPMFWFSFCTLFGARGRPT